MIFDYDELIDNIRDIKEKHFIELKRAMNAVPKSFWETYSSFCNTDGGIIILGVEEGPEENILTGVNQPKNIVSDLWNQLSNKTKVNYNAWT